jgi:hypothetical protein
MLTSKNGNLVVLVLCHIQGASAPTDGALPRLVPFTIVRALVPSVPIGTKL